MALPKSRVKIQWSPKFAYAVGLLVSDGNLSKDRRHLNFTSKDKALVLLFRRCLALRTKISKKSRGAEFEKKYYYTQFGDVLFYKYLLTIGLTPNKSKTIASLKIPDKFFFDFLRGSFDGDGTIYSYWDKRWKHSFMFYTVFLSASRPHLEWLRTSNERLAGIRGHITTSRKIFQLKYAKSESLILFKKMFYKEGLPCLGRKHKKAQAIFRVE